MSTRHVRNFALAALVLFATSPLRAQTTDQFEVALKFKDGRFITDRQTARIALSDRYHGLLRPGVTDDQLKTQFCDALDREFELMPKPYFFTLKDTEKTLDRQGLLKDPQFEALRTWNGTIAAFPPIGIFGDERESGGTQSYNAQVEKVLEHSALAEWLNPQGRIDRLLFRVRDPLPVATLSIPHPGAVLDDTRVRELLSPLDRLPANPEQMGAMLLDFAVPRGWTPKITTKLESSPPELSVFDTSRIANFLLPAELDDVSKAEQIAYNALPNRVFKAFRRQARTGMPGTLAGGATKREVNLRTLVDSAEAGNPAHTTFEPPPVDALTLADIQQRLIALGYTASLFDSVPEELLLDLVIDATTPQEGAAAESNPLAGTTETPPNTPAASARPHAAADIQPAPVIAAPTQDPKHSANTPQRELKNFVGGGLEYRPGQGVRALGSFQRKNTFGRDLTRVEGGGMGEGFGSAEYSRDYLFFDRLGRRLSVDFSGGSEFEQQRILNNVLTDERRSGASARVDLEAYRDGPGHQLNLSLGGRRESVSLSPSDVDSDVEEISDPLTALDVGAAYRWSRSLVAHPVTVRIEPAVRVGLPIAGATTSFTRISLGTQYHQSIAGPIEVESRFQLRHATEATPVFEQPSLGGMDSVRGFRADERVGGTLWALQNELWLPIPSGRIPSKFRDFVRRNVRLAGLYDFGRLTSATTGTTDDGYRQGTGVGLRIRYQGVVIETDWAYGFGSGDAERPGHGHFYFNFRLP